MKKTETKAYMNAIHTIITANIADLRKCQQDDSKPGSVEGVTAGMIADRLDQLYGCYRYNLISRSEFMEKLWLTMWEEHL